MLLTHAFETAREIGDRTEMAYAMADLVRVHVERGDLDAACTALEASLPRAATMEARVIVLLALEGGRPRGRARRRPARRAPVVGGRRGPRGQRLREHARGHAAARGADGRASRRLDATAFAEAWAEGQAMWSDAAVEAAMSLVGTPAATATA